MVIKMAQQLMCLFCKCRNERSHMSKLKKIIIPVGIIGILLCVGVWFTIQQFQVPTSSPTIIEEVSKPDVSAQKGLDPVGTVCGNVLREEPEIGVATPEQVAAAAAEDKEDISTEDLQ
jgi:hypothetical protein